MDDIRCANCHYLRWRLKCATRKYLCRNFAPISNPSMSVCAFHTSRMADWSHQPSEIEMNAEPAVALTTGLPSKGLRELALVQDYSAAVLYESSCARRANAQLREQLAQEVEEVEGAAIQIC